MKRLFTIVSCIVALLVSSCGYDDTKLWQKVNDHESRIVALEELCREMNTNIDALQSLLEAVENSDYITAVTPVTKEGETVGYTIEFAKGEPITIYHGTNGADGADGTNGTTPVIGVEQDADGIYYWTLNGEWLTDANGNKIKASGLDGKDGADGEDGKDGANGEDGKDGVNGNDGANGKDGKDGITPQLKIENNYWYVSYDNGATWVEVAMAVVEAEAPACNAIFESVVEKDGYVYFTLLDGTVITVAKAIPMEVYFAEEDLMPLAPNATRDLHYTVDTLAEKVDVEVISSLDIVAEVVADDYSAKSGVIRITAGDQLAASSRVVLLVSNGMQVIMRSITFEPATIRIEENDTKVVSYEGGNVELEFLSNIKFNVILPEEAAAWLSFAPTTRTLQKHVVTLATTPNRNEVREAKVRIESEDKSLFVEYTIKQEMDPRVWNGDYTELPAANEEGYVVITTPAQLATYLTAETKGINIRLATDVDFDGRAISYIANTKSEDQSTFDGQNHTIANFVVANEGNYGGLFGYITNITVKDLTIADARIVPTENNEGDYYAGALAGTAAGYCAFENVKVINSKVEGVNKVGGLVGNVAENFATTFTNCSVEGTTVRTLSAEDGGCVGGLVGYVVPSTIFNGNAVKNSTIEAINSANDAKRANAEFIGAFHGNGNTLTLEGNTLEGNTFTEAETTYEAPAAFGAWLGGVRILGESKVIIDGEKVLAPELKPLATPAVTATVELNVVTLTWEAVENAYAYNIIVNNEMPVVTEETAYTFTGEYETEYNITVVAVPETEEVYTLSEPATVTVTTEAEPAPENYQVTVAEFLAAAEDDTVYELTGVITNIANTTYGNFYLKDDTGEVYVYGLDLSDTNIDWSGGTNLNVGDTITIKGKRSSYNGTAQVKDAYYAWHVDGEEPVIEAQKVTVAEFLAAAEDASTMYELTGVITSVANTTYGNFDLTDETGTVYIYGLCSPEGAQKYWAESGAKLGDTITIQTVRTSFNGVAQGKNALFIELVPFVEEASEWGLVGNMWGWEEYKGTDVVMYNTWKAKDLFVAYNVEIASGAFKVRANNEWNDAKNYGLKVGGKVYADKYYSVFTGGGSQNITPMVYGTYDVYFDLANECVALVTPGKEYADAVNGGDPVVVIEGLRDHEWGLVGSFNGWDVANYVVTEVQGDWAVAKNVTLANGAEFKFAADKAWTLSYGSACDVNVGETYTTYKDGNNMKFVGEAGAYNVYFSLVDAKFYMETYISATTVEGVAANFGYTNAALVESVILDENITLTFEQGKASTAPAYYTSGEAIRLYQNGAIMNVNANGRTITAIEITFANNMYYLAADSGEFTEEAEVRTWTGSAESVKFTCTGTDKNHRAYIKAIKVTYE